MKSHRRGFLAVDPRERHKQNLDRILAAQIAYEFNLSPAIPAMIVHDLEIPNAEFYDAHFAKQALERVLNTFAPELGKQSL
jgi:hypothetical protein